MQRSAGDHKDKKGYLLKFIQEKTNTTTTQITQNQHFKPYSLVEHNPLFCWHFSLKKVDFFFWQA